MSNYYQANLKAELVARYPTLNLYHLFPYKVQPTFSVLKLTI